MGTKKIIIGADIAFINRFKKFHIGKNIDKKLQKYISKVDFRIYDLELPITETGEPIHKTGPNLRIDPAEIEGLQELKPDLLVTANNHIMDYGVVGLDSTLRALERKNIQSIGSGIKQIRKEYFFSMNGLKISVYNCAEKEFVEENGISYVNTFSEKTVSDIIQLKSQSDYVIVLYHGGIEHYPYPARYLIDRCHVLADSGADLILCQHNHILGAREKYNSTEILYGQGDFIADYNCQNIDWGLLVELQVDDNKHVNIKYTPIKRIENRVSLLFNEESQIILNEFESRSGKNFAKEYEKYCGQEIYVKLQYCCALPSLLKKIDNHTNHFIIKKIFKRNKLLLLQNVIRCDAHKNIIIDGIDELLNHE